MKKKYKDLKKENNNLLLLVDLLFDKWYKRRKALIRLYEKYEEKGEE